MGDFDSFDHPEPEVTIEMTEYSPPRTSRGGGPVFLYNLFTVLFLMATMGSCALVIFIAYNPTHPVNLLPPHTPGPTPTLFSFFESDPDLGEIDLSGRPSATEPLPEIQPTATPFSEVEDNTPQVSPDPTGAGQPGEGDITEPEYSFKLQNETLNYTTYFGVEGCNYLAVAGQVFDADGQPVLDIPVVVEGPDQFSALAFTGSAEQYGISGYEVKLGTAPREADYTIHLIRETGQRLSEKYTVRTTASCEENLIIVNFVAIEPLE